MNSESHLFKIVFFKDSLEVFYWKSELLEQHFEEFCNKFVEEILKKMLDFEKFSKKSLEEFWKTNLETAARENFERIFFLEKYSRIVLSGSA